MLKRKYIVLMLILMSDLVVNAQHTELKNYLLTSELNTFGISILNTHDDYLSPLTYSGLGLNLTSYKSRFLGDNQTNISTQSYLKSNVGLLFNPQISSAMLQLSENYGWGLQYHFRVQKNILILAGGLVDIDAGMKYVDRNVNNPFNVDLATNLNLTGKIIYDIPLKKKKLHLQLALQSPVIGCMYVPLAGASYYEMFMLGNLVDAVHFSSIHNKRGLNSTLTVEVPFNRSVWHFGINTQDIKYSANNMVFSNNQISFVVGTSLDRISFSGKKNKAPDNFISPNY